MTQLPAALLYDLVERRHAIHQKWGRHDHPDLHDPSAREFYSAEAERWKAHNARKLSDSECGAAWDTLLLEELFEALSETNPQLLRDELLQIIIIAVDWIDALAARD